MDVHIGAQRVGSVSIAEQLTPAIEAAADRDEDLWMIASLRPSGGRAPYALEITVPH
jgi:hypothetical protein